jgi:hypothetical protein
MAENQVEKVEEIAAENTEVAVEEVKEEKTEPKPSKPKVKRLRSKNLNDSPLQSMIDINLITTNYTTDFESVPEVLSEYVKKNGLPLPISCVDRGGDYLCYHGSSIVALAEESGHTHVSSLVFDNKADCVHPASFLDLEIHEGLEIDLGEAENVLRYYF